MWSINCFRMSVDEDDKRDKLGPTISYLQKLGPEYLTQIFEASHWVLETDRDMAFEVSWFVILFRKILSVLRFLLPKNDSFQKLKWLIIWKTLIPICAFVILNFSYTKSTTCPLKLMDASLNLILGCLSEARVTMTLVSLN